MHTTSGQSSAILQSLLSATKNLRFNRHFQITEVSALFLSQFGLPKSGSWLGMDISEVIDLKEAVVINKSSSHIPLSAYLEKNESILFESKLLPLFPIRYIRGVLAPALDAQGELESLTCLVMETTAYKAQQVALQKANIDLSKKIFFEEKSKETLQTLNHALEQKNTKLNGYTATLMDLAKNYIHTGLTLDDVLEQMLKMAQKALDVHRIGYWNYNESAKCITAIKIYMQETDGFETGSVLYAKDFPKYFQHILQEKTIVASDALTDESTQEFKDNYLITYNIRSMLDQPVLEDGVLKGILCVEHKYAKRTWRAEDIIFVKGLSDLITISMQHQKIKEDKLKIVAQQEEIVKQNIELKEQQAAIKSINEHLEHIIEERNMLLAFKEHQINEYAHVNAHELRAPFCRLKGLIYLLTQHDLSAKEIEYIESNISKSILDLEEVVQKISHNLNENSTNSISMI